MTATTPGNLAPESPAPLVDPAAIAWAGLAVLAAACFWLRGDLAWLIDYPADWILPVSGWIDQAMDAFVAVFKPLFRAAAFALRNVMDGIHAVLVWLPWPATVSALTIVSYRAGGWRLATFTAAALGYVLVFGYWMPTMATLALVAMSVPLSVLLGLAVGLAAFRWRAVERVVMPTLDVMQTFPAFAYLIPILFLFGFGPVVGLVASAIYAMPPMVRNTILGLSRVRPEIIEAGQMSGATGGQLLWLVRIPAALPTLMVGVNQSTMAAFSMVIIASVIGGSGDIGWEVLSTMRKAQFGQSFMAGIVIALMAMVMDRISRGFAEQAGRARATGSAHRERERLLVLAVILMTGFIALAQAVPSLAVWPSAWVPKPAEPLNRAVDWIISNYSSVLDAIKETVLFYFLLPFRIGMVETVSEFSWGFELTQTVILVFLGISGAVAAILASLWGWRPAVAWGAIAMFYYFGLSGTPWPVFIGLVTLVAFQTGGWRLAFFSAMGLAFILLTGVWSPAMRSVYLCGAAVLFAFVAGGALGILAASSDRFSAFVRPINDTLQTMPLFVFLIPVIMFFQIGDFSALLAIIMYAIVPAIRYTEHGLRSINPATIEAAAAQGCTPRQILWHVKLPLALPEIMLGLNQTIVFALAMLVVAALVGTKGLGQAVYIALNAGKVGDGVVAGLSMGIIAMIADRITQAWSLARKRELGIA